MSGSVPSQSGGRGRDWDAGRRPWTALLLILALHAVVLWGLMQIRAVREAIEESAPIMVGLITPAPPAPPKVKPPPPPKVMPKPQPKPRMIVSEAPAVPSAITAPPPDPEPVIQEPPPPPQGEPAPVEPIVPPSFVAAYLDNPAPSYPAASRRGREQGRVMLRVLVSTEGRPESIEVEKSSGYSRLDNAALDAVKRWKFVPARQGERTVRAWVLVPIDFLLHSG